MSDKSESKPREFWMILSNPNAESFTEAFVSIGKPDHGALKGLSTHVIEYSAYEALQSQLASAKAEIEVRREDTHKLRTMVTAWENQNAEIDQLKSQLSEMNQNCISLMLHESRMKAVEAQLEAVKVEHLKDHDDLINRLEHSYHFCIGVERERDKLKTQLEHSEQGFMVCRQQLAEAQAENLKLNQDMNRLCEVKDETVNDCRYNHNMFLEEQKNHLIALAERDALKAEIERWKSEASTHARVADQCAAEKLTLKAEVENLKLALADRSEKYKLWMDKGLDTLYAKNKILRDGLEYYVREAYELREGWVIAAQDGIVEYTSGKKAREALAQADAVKGDG